ncbi:SHOCT domain-containing protein [Alkalicoccus chagannorensis]|uniref:SHOCT domain-containing protein n=1 Tax=Alkalicoccus chagannorensis TaxID=427072 RepID=UPI0003F7BE00|nr:SHOCT domain-containing protein [Alkalicoccus chagannorensis]
MHQMNEMFFGGGWLMNLFWLLVAALIIAGIVLLIKAIASAGDQGTSAPPEQEYPKEESRKILEERYARGEINEEEFERKKAKLRE